MKFKLVIATILASFVCIAQTSDYSLNSLYSFSVNADNVWNSSTYDNPLGMNLKMYSEDGLSATRFGAVFNVSHTSLESFPGSTTNDVVSANQIVLFYGQENRWNSGRIQGYRGYDCGLYSAGTSVKLSTSTEWDGAFNRGVFGRVFIGADCFILPRLSLGTEIGYGVSYGFFADDVTGTRGSSLVMGNDMLSAAAGKIMLTYYFPSN